MITSEIIKRFELYVDDTTELSSSEELNLANKIYDFICNDRDWEFLKKEATGTVSGTQITLPTDFSHILENYNYTQNNYSSQLDQSPKVVLIGNNPIAVINWSDRKKYINNSNYCYVDIVSGKLNFMTSQSGTYSFDYKFNPPALTLSTSPVFPEKFHHMIYHGMAVDDMITQLFDKARSYAGENQLKFNEFLKQLVFWNSSLLNY